MASLPACPRRRGVMRRHSQVLRNDYGDLLERWKVDLIRARAKRLFFRDDEIPDLEQVIVMELLEADHRPDVAGGASEATFAVAVIDRQLREIKRYKARDRRKANYAALSLEGEPAVWEEAESLSVEADDPGLRLDMAEAMPHLRPAERAIYLALSQGQSQAAIARATGRSKAAICDGVRELRKKFLRRGLDEYLAPKPLAQSRRPRPSRL